MRSSSAGSRRRPCCHRPTPPPCCSRRCSLPAKSTCAKSMAGKRSPSSRSINRSTSPRDHTATKKGGIKHRPPLEQRTSGLPNGSFSQPEVCLNADRQSDSFHIAGDRAAKNSNHIPDGTKCPIVKRSLIMLLRHRAAAFPPLSEQEQALSKRLLQRGLSKPRRFSSVGELVKSSFANQSNSAILSFVNVTR